MVIRKNINTKYGTAHLNEDGYYQISSRKEGNKGKHLHRVFYEDYYGMKIPEGYQIHHKNGKRHDNRIWNLELLSGYEHRSMHNAGEKNNCFGGISEEHKENISRALNTSGYFRVSKMKCPKCKKGYIFVYKYFNDSGERKSLSSDDIEKLEEKVNVHGLTWKKL